MSLITAKDVNGVQHVTVRSYLKRGRTFVFDAVEEDSDKPVVVKVTNARDIAHAKDLAWTLGWVVKEPA